MSRIPLWCLCFVAVLTAIGEAETKPTAPATAASVCEVVGNPEWFSGKIVSLRATVLSGFEISAIRAPEEDCGRMWLEYAKRDEDRPTSSASPHPARESSL